MRSPPDGNEMKAQRAPVALHRASWRTTRFSREVIEPPDIFLSAPGFAFAASMKSFKLLIGEFGLDHDDRGLHHEAGDRVHVRELVGRGLLDQRVAQARYW